MKRIAFIGFFLLIGIHTLSARIKTDAIVSKLELVGRTDVQALKSNREVSFENVFKNTGWKPYDSTFIGTPDTTIWIRFQLENTTEDTVKTYLFCLSNYSDIYYQNVQAYEHLKNGNMRPLKERSNKREHYFTEIKLLPLQQSWCYIKLSSNYINYDCPVLYSKSNYLEFVYDLRGKASPSVAFIYTYLISLCCIFSFALVFYFRLRKRIYFYYLAYLFFQIIYGLLVLRFTHATVANFALYVPEFSHLIFEPVQFAFIGFYIFFILSLLEIKTFDIKLSKILISFGVFCFVYALLRFVFDCFWGESEINELIFTIVRMIVLPLNFVLFFWIIYKAKHPLLKYFIFGQSLFFIGSLLSSIISYTEVFLVPGSIFNFPYSQNIIFQAGLLGEVFCFSIALGESVFLIQKEKDNANRELIEQLQQNQRLQENMRIELDKQVNEKTNELIKLYSEIEKQKEIQLKKSFSERLCNMEMLALRSQMNPHFIFNSLNALKNLVMMSREEDAIQYLDNFSVLLRTILQNSSKNTITVEEELEMLELYLSIEKSRLGEDFSYVIHCNSREELSQYTIPPLLLQPFVENAIWHGLQPSEKTDKKLSIIFDTEQRLKITIEDNGVGRVESGKAKKLHKSVGTNITKERLSLYNHASDSKMHLRILDLEYEGVSAGTRIIITYNE